MAARTAGEHPTERKPNTAERGFTLVELLVVIAIIGILVALLLPAVQAARESARRSQCNNQLKQMGLAVLGHHDTRGAFPTGRRGADQFSVSWAFLLLPYLEEQAVFDAYDPTLRVDDPANAVAMRTPIAVYACPSRRPAAADRDFDNNGAEPLVRDAAVLGDYGANAGLEQDIGTEENDFLTGAFGGPIDLTLAGPIYSGSEIKARQVLDGLSKTIAVGEKHIPPAQQDWIDEGLLHLRQGDTCFLSGDHIPTILCGSEDGLAIDPTDDTVEAMGGEHPGVTLVVFLDGHTEALSDDVGGGTASGVNPNEVEDIGIDDEWLLLGALTTVAGSEIIIE